MIAIKNFTVILLMLSFLLSFENKAQIIFESRPIEIDFKNPYKFNSIIEKKLEDKNQIEIFQAFLDYSNKGAFMKAQELDDIERKKQGLTPSDTPKQIDSVNSRYTAVDAIDYIISKAKNHQITIINEAHHNPRHRVFTMSLLEKLYNSGYTHLGIEALYNGPIGGTPLGNGGKIRDEKDSLINIRKYPIQKSGSYIKEPQFGNLIRYALELGLTVFSYEKSGVGSGYPREVGQAKNIQSIMQENPDAKFLIYCGYAHAYEGDYKAWGKTMTGQLKEITGINPLSIDQVKYSEHSKPEYNESLYNALNLKVSSVLVDLEGNSMRFVEGNAYTDIAVIHPPTQYINSRPSWLYQNGFKSVKLDLSMLNIELGLPIMVLAFNKGEDINNAIPVDILEINTNEVNVNFALRSGEYTIVVVDIEGEAVKLEMTVK